MYGIFAALPPPSVSTIDVAAVHHLIFLFSVLIFMLKAFHSISSPGRERAPGYIHCTCSHEGVSAVRHLGLSALYVCVEWIPPFGPNIPK